MSATTAPGLAAAKDTLARIDADARARASLDRARTEFALSDEERRRGVRFPRSPLGVRIEPAAPEHYAAVRRRVEEIDRAADGHADVVTARAEYERLRGRLAEANGRRAAAIAATTAATADARKALARGTDGDRSRRRQADQELRDAELLVADLEALAGDAHREWLAVRRSTWSALRDALKAELAQLAGVFQQRLLQAEIDSKWAEARALAAVRQEFGAGCADACPEVFRAAAETLALAAPPPEPLEAVEPSVGEDDQGDDQGDDDE